MLRLRKTRWKIAYIAVGVGLSAVINGVVVPGLLGEPSTAVASNVFFALFVFGGVRSFRGSDEPVKPPRAWLRMTARPRAGFVLGGLCVLFFISSIFSVAFSASDPASAGVDDALVNALLAFLYIRSSIRLHRTPPKTEPQRAVPSLPPWKPLKL